ncbi:MAG: L-histidine N(alpha)-methyltransferase [Actinomycetes bacterium]
MTDPKTVRERLERDVRVGLTAVPPWLPARWFYDEKGSLLFDDITTLPEYYPTRRETEILAAHGNDIVTATGATTLIELGAGLSKKTRLILDAFTAEGRAVRFVPIDVSAEALAYAAQTITDAYPSVLVDARVADFEDDLAPLPGTPGERLVLFLGGTIGNLNTGARDDFWAKLRTALTPGDHFLLGADLVKDVDRLVNAYDDARGVTAAFNRNIIEVLARELSAEGLSSDDFAHVARWNPERSQIEMWLRAIRPISAYFRTLDLHWSLPTGGELLTEISVKFTLPGLRAELTHAGLTPVTTWTDNAGDFSLTLARRD